MRKGHGIERIGRMWEWGLLQCGAQQRRLERKHTSYNLGNRRNLTGENQRQQFSRMRDQEEQGSEWKLRMRFFKEILFFVVVRFCVLWSQGSATLCLLGVLIWGPWTYVMGFLCENQFQVPGSGCTVELREPGAASIIGLLRTGRGMGWVLWHGEQEEKAYIRQLQELFTPVIPGNGRSQKDFWVPMYDFK